MAYIPTILEAGRADGILIKTNSVYDDNQNRFVSDILEDFKDRDNTNGMGYIILRKNKSFAEQVTRENTIYEIRYNFTLDNNITIPDNCVLKFNGGSISGNKTLTGNNTQIKAQDIVIFENGVNIDGTWICSKITSEWFADANEEDRILQVFNLCSNTLYNKVYIDNRTFIVSAKNFNNGFPYKGKGIELNKKNTYIILDGTIKMKNNSFENYSVFLITADNISINNGNIVGDKDGHIYPSDSGTHEWGHGVLLFNASNFNINGTNISNCTGDGIYVNRSININISNINISNCRRQGISLTDDCHNIVIENFSISNISGASPQSGIDIEPNTLLSSNIFIRNGIISNSNNGIQLYTNSTIESLGGINNIKIDNILTTNITTYSIFMLGKSKNIQITNCQFDAECRFANSVKVILNNCIIEDATKVMLSTTNKVELTIYNSTIISANNANAIKTSILKAYNSIIKIPLNSNNTIYKLTECDVEIENGSWQAVFGDYIRCTITNPNDTAFAFNGNIISSSIILSNSNISATAIVLNTKTFKLQDVKFIALETITVSNLINYNVGVNAENAYIINIITEKINYTYFSNSLPNKGVVIKNETPRVDDSAFFYKNNALFIGAYKFDGTKPLWWNGKVWVDATGTPV